MFENMRWDGWELFGLVGEGLFFARLVAQWAASEKRKKPVIPTVYWYMSLAGAIILVLYALHIGSFPVLLPQVVGLVFYSRGLQLEYISRKNDTRRASLGLDRSDYPWPTMSVVVPVHNEEKSLAGTLLPLVDQDYPGKVEIIAALNGCSDGSRAVAEGVPGVIVVESERSGMSYGKNFGASRASGSLLVFVDADTILPGGALRLLGEGVPGKERVIGTVAGAPDKGGLVVRSCFAIANRATRRKRAHAPGGVMVMDKATFDAVGGFDETIPQGTSTDMIWRGLAAGAEYVFIDSFKAVTSIRRFEKTGIIGQMLSWRRNHKHLTAGRRNVVAGRAYEDVR
ncbi:MAG: lipid-A-disaccharide synthase N-terminal domain-containing protein [Planctomycetaceae bacterium]|nr:lipid-A-disaccharide synthase N-terminal domain-containing protein [Planctomycetaceae bacterium]